MLVVLVQLLHQQVSGVLQLRGFAAAQGPRRRWLLLWGLLVERAPCLQLLQQRGAPAPIEAGGAIKLRLLLLHW